MTLTHYFRVVDLQARMQLKADAAKFKLGFLWWFLEPLLWVGVFYVVFNLILDSSRRGGDYIVFLSCGKFAFIWFSKTVTQAANSITSNKGLISKINVPKSVFPMAAMQESLYRQSAVYLLLFALLVAFDTPVTRVWFWLIPVLVVSYVFIIACSFVGAYLVCLLRDFSKIIPLVMTFLLFTSGIFWDVRLLGDPEKTELILRLNPVAFIIDAHRQILMYENTPDLTHLFLIGLFSALVAAVMMTLMSKSSEYLALKVLTA